MREEQKKKPRLAVPDELTIQLSKSVRLTGSEETVVTEISLHEPNVSQLSQFIKKTQKENAVDAMKYLISLVSGLPMPVLDQIGVRDFYAAQDYLILFITPPDEDDPEGNAVASQ
jgi:uncharacterized protein YjaZ